MASAKQSAGIRLASISPIMSWEKEAVMVVLGILGLLIAFGGFVVALLTLLDKRKRK